jgi:thioesterase domain-containing protein
MEDIAAGYVKALKDRQPDGPYLIGGYCWGCSVAFEMARQLVDNGDELAMLLFIDPLHREYYSYFLESDLFLTGLLVQVMNPGKEISMVSFEHLQELTLDEQLEAIYNQILSDGYILPEVTLDDFKEMLHVFRMNLTALVRYQPVSTDKKGAIVLVEDYPEDWLGYWKDLLPDGLKTINIPGNHYSFWVDDSQMSVLYGALEQLIAELPAEARGTVKVS